MTASGRRRTANARASAIATASTAVIAPRRTLLSAHSRKRDQGSTDQSAASGRSMNSTGATKPISTGSTQTSQAATLRQPRRRKGWASAEPARPAPLVAKRMRRWARISSCSSSTTSTSRNVASWAAAMRLSMDSQAL
ncbi:hypothetical protein D3C78_1586390 [compost metagenome]